MRWSTRILCAIGLAVGALPQPSFGADFVEDPDIAAVVLGQRVVVHAHSGNNVLRYYFDVSAKLNPQFAIVRFEITTSKYIVDVTLGDGTVVQILEDNFLILGAAPDPPTKASPAPIPIANDADTLDVACDSRTAVVVGANSATPVALVDLVARQQLATASYPGKLARSVAVDDAGGQALVVIDDNTVQITGEIRRLVIASGTLSDSGARLAFPNEYISRVFIAPGAKIGVAIVGSGATRLVSFSIPGLTPIGSVNLVGVGNAVAFSPSGDAVYVRSGPRGIADTIERYPLNPSTGAIGQTSTLSIGGISGFAGVVYQKPMAITPDGTKLVVADENVLGSLPAPRVAWYSTSTGALLESSDLPAGSQPRIVSTLRACAVRGAIEYYHAAFDHYFATSIADEIAKLDNGTFAGWARTSKQFNVYASGAAGMTPTCRFFSTSFGAKSSHFYATSASECATVKANPNWQFEGEVFATQPPAPDGTCAPPAVPLYRVYNNGSGGAPNHRYTTQTDVRAQMIAQGWIPEGLGIGVVACVAP